MSLTHEGSSYTYKLLEPFKSTMPGAYGIHFWFEFTESCDFFYSYTYDGMEMYLPSEGVSRATFGDMSVMSSPKPARHRQRR